MKQRLARKPAGKTVRAISINNINIIQKSLVVIFGELAIINEILGTSIVKPDEVVEIIESVFKEKLINLNESGRPKRYNNLAYARHIARYLLRKYTNITNNEIAKLTGASEHSSVNTSVKVYNNLLQTSEEFREKANRCLLLITMR